MHARVGPGLRLKIAVGLLIPLVVVLGATSAVRYASHRADLLETLDST